MKGAKQCSGNREDSDMFFAESFKSESRMHTCEYLVPVKLSPVKLLICRTIFF